MRLFGLLAALGVADCILQLLHFYQSHNVATTGTLGMTMDTVYASILKYSFH